MTRRPSPRRPASARAHKAAHRPLSGRVRDVTLAGDAVVETTEGVVLARGALPGELVELSAGPRRRGVRWGRLLQVLEPSLDRVEPACALAGRCGGCPLMALAHPAQLEHKRRLVQRALAGLAPAELEVKLHAATDPLHYRRRARLAFVGAEGSRGPCLGYRLPGSHELLDVAACPVLEPELERALVRVRDGLLPRLVGRGEVSLALGEQGRAVVHVAAERAQPPEAYTAAQELAETLHGVALSVDGGAPARWGAPAQAQRTANDATLLAPAEGFAQANSAMNERLVACVRELSEASGARVLELYAGHGNLSVPLASEAAELHAVEADAQAAQALRAHLSAHGLSHARVTTGPAAAHVGRGPVDVVVLDPPRAGARDVLDPILRRRPARIVYVSCQPPTLRRDVQQLAAGGYALDAAVALDMFPHTGHVEAVVRLRPR